MENKTTRSGRRNWRLRALTLGCGCIGLGIVMASVPEPQQALDAQQKLSVQQIELTIPEPSASLPSAQASPSSHDATAKLETQEVVVKSGDSLSAIFSRLGIPYKELMRIQALGDPIAALKTVYPGDKLLFRLDSEQKLQQLSFAIDEAQTLIVNATADGYQADLHVVPLERRLLHAQGRIEHSLFVAGQEAGISEAMIMELANIFGWDIDFALDVRQGDSFSLVYEAFYRDGEKVREGNILAAEFINQGDAFHAVRYSRDHDDADYFSPDKHSLRKAFLKSPVKFSRISSGFTSKRFHPVHKKFRAHRGVDYAASTGTPVRATGDGKIILRGNKGGYGKTVIVQHGQSYSTLYAHLSAYNSKLKSGSRVKQGQVIGYVGMTGTATGPHLHYEFRVNGVHRNPLTVKLPAAEPLQAEYHADFDQLAEPLLNQLRILSQSRLALVTQ